MSTTEMTAEQIEDRLRELAPYPEWGTRVTAKGVARYLAVCAQLGFARNITPFIRDDQEISSPLIVAQFAAAHTLLAIAETDEVLADEVAQRIVDGWVDGNSLGAYLYSDLTTLGVDPDEVARLDEVRLTLENAARSGETAP